VVTTRIMTDTRTIQNIQGFKKSKNTEDDTVTMKQTQIEDAEKNITIVITIG